MEEVVESSGYRVVVSGEGAEHEEGGEASNVLNIREESDDMEEADDEEEEFKSCEDEEER